MDNASLILEQISELKNKLESLVYLYGFSSPTVLKCSRELDELIYQIQLLNHVPLNRNGHKNREIEGNY
ncbi:aspartyl-phosphate phosphatase Spo0E family protein [Neobacillus sp. SAB-20_R2A]|uniref:aspartyl-phosphate phosphatase Spo0E family protein n=1 Tax=Neobacillus sp. SAB-20_R2A TaxID=3120519 RepID=UPI003C6E3C05